MYFTGLFVYTYITCRLYEQIANFHSEFFVYLILSKAISCLCIPFVKISSHYLTIDGNTEILSNTNQAWWS